MIIVKNDVTTKCEDKEAENDDKKYHVLMFRVYHKCSKEKKYLLSITH